mmetsp:Transcript_139345/g.242287  ORF Transcript_139345/g.242287 Transcript_139345/m.242287 type:complete len:100 (-) Transcript_139345:1631-1930(-)
MAPMSMTRKCVCHNRCCSCIAVQWQKSVSVHPRMLVFGPCSFAATVFECECTILGNFHTVSKEMQLLEFARLCIPLMCTCGPCSGRQCSVQPYNLLTVP